MHKYLNKVPHLYYISWSRVDTPREGSSRKFPKTQGSRISVITKNCQELEFYSVANYLLLL